MTSYSKTSYLAHITNSDSEAADINLETVEELTEADLQMYKEDKKLISSFHQSLSLIKIVELNVSQFFEAFVSNAKSYLIDEQMHEEKMDAIAFEYSRLLFNILSAFTAFLEHSRRSIVHCYGRKSVQLSDWDKITNEYYQKSFAYCLLYELRNYTHHIGMLPLKISFQSSEEQKGVALSLSILRDEILNNIGKSRSDDKLEKILINQKSVIPVLPILDEWGVNFESLSKFILNIKQQSSVKSAERIVAHRNRLELPKIGRLSIVHFQDEESDADKIDFTIEDLPEKKASFILNTKI